MDRNVEVGRGAEAQKNYGGAIARYRKARGSDDGNARYAAALGLLRIYEGEKGPRHPLAVLGGIMLALTLLSGGFMMLNAVAQGMGYQKSVNVIQLMVGAGLTFNGLILSSLLIAAGRAVRLLETMEARQACEREARVRGEQGVPGRN